MFLYIIYSVHGAFLNFIKKTLSLSTMYCSNFPTKDLEYDVVNELEKKKDVKKTRIIKSKSGLALALTALDVCVIQMLHV